RFSDFIGPDEDIADIEEAREIVVYPHLPAVRQDRVHAMPSMLTIIPARNTKTTNRVFLVNRQDGFTGMLVHLRIERAPGLLVGLPIEANGAVMNSRSFGYITLVPFYRDIKNPGLGLFFLNCLYWYKPVVAPKERLRTWPRYFFFLYSCGLS